MGFAFEVPNTKIMPATVLFERLLGSLLMITSTQFVELRVAASQQRPNCSMQKENTTHKQ